MHFVSAFAWQVWWMWPTIFSTQETIISSKKFLLHIITQDLRNSLEYQNQIKQTMKMLTAVYPAAELAIRPAKTVPVTTSATFQTQYLRLPLSPRLTWAQEEPFLELRRTDGRPSFDISQLSRFSSMLIQVLENSSQPGSIMPFVFFIYLSRAVFFFLFFVFFFSGDFGTKLTHISSRCFWVMEQSILWAFSQGLVWWEENQSWTPEEDEHLCNPRLRVCYWRGASLKSQICW